MQSIERSMPLADLLPQNVVLHGDSNVLIQGINSDSRNICAGDLFVAKTGFNQRGSDYIQAAREKGAVAVVTDDESLKWQVGDLPTALVPDLERNISKMASQFFCHPTQHISVIGITGTNGKTSCCYWYAWLSNRLGATCGEIGTLGAGIKQQDNEKLPSTGFTTPDAIAVQSIMAGIRDAGAQAVVMEVSSHGLDQGRVEAVQFETAIFTNLSQDHLDYHGDMTAYLSAKAKLFGYPSLRRVILNLDDAAYDPLKNSVCASDTAIYSYSLQNPSADLYVEHCQWSANGAQVTLAGGWGAAHIFAPIIGEYNLANVLAVITALLAAGFEFSDIARALAELPPVPGRMQQVSVPKNNELQPAVIVDYAHTPDAVAGALRAIRKQVDGRLVAVLGCGGDRDREKRPLMAAAAARLADETWVTSDNPRSEPPESILKDMLGELDPATLEIEVDRRAAIYGAIASASHRDTVLILGKGHETYQEIKGTRYPFDDVEVATTALNLRSAATGVRK